MQYSNVLSWIAVGGMSFKIFFFKDIAISCTSGAGMF